MNDKIQVATNPSPNKSPVAYVHPSKYAGYTLNPDIETANRCIEMLKAEGFNAEGNPNFDWIHDTYLILIRMFPGGCPPTEDRQTRAGAVKEVSPRPQQKRGEKRAGWCLLDAVFTVS